RRSAGPSPMLKKATSPRRVASSPTYPCNSVDRSFMIPPSGKSQVMPRRQRCCAGSIGRGGSILECVEVFAVKQAGGRFTVSVEVLKLSELEGFCEKKPVSVFFW